MEAHGTWLDAGRIKVGAHLFYRVAISERPDGDCDAAYATDQPVSDSGPSRRSFHGAADRRMRRRQPADGPDGVVHFFCRRREGLSTFFHTSIACHVATLYFLTTGRLLSKPNTPARPKLSCVYDPCSHPSPACANLHQCSRFGGELTRARPPSQLIHQGCTRVCRARVRYG